MARASQAAAQANLADLARTRFDPRFPVSFLYFLETFS